MSQCNPVLEFDDEFFQDLWEVWFDSFLYVVLVQISLAISASLIIQTQKNDGMFLSVS